MIGQKQLIELIDKQISEDKFPKFSIIVGAKGSGKKLIVEHIAKQLGAHIYKCSIKMDDIKELIDNSNRITDTILFILADADTMSQNAKNALLKLTEEPPKNAYIIMTLQDENNTLATIRSRGTVYNMNVYTPEELQQYALDLNNHLNPEEMDIIMNICSTPLEVKELINVGVIEFWEYVYKVIDNIAKVSGANAFKISDKIKVKEDKGVYDITLFWKAFMMLCVEEMTSDIDKRYKYSNAVRITSKCLQKLRTNGINKMMLFDNWILDIRNEWR